MSTTARRHLINATGAVLAAELAAGQPGPEDISAAEAARLHEARRITDGLLTLLDDLAARAIRTRDDIDEPRRLLFANLIFASLGAIDGPEALQAVRALVDLRPDAFCRHCTRPIREEAGQLIDDAPRERDYCPHAISYRHARADSDVVSAGRFDM